MESELGVILFTIMSITTIKMNRSSKTKKGVGGGGGGDKRE